MEDFPVAVPPYITLTFDSPISTFFIERKFKIFYFIYHSFSPNLNLFLNYAIYELNLSMVILEMTSLRKFLLNPFYL